MKLIIPLNEIFVPQPRPEETYSINLLDRSFYFDGLKKLLGAADVSKAGDRTTGLAAEDEVAREAARLILSELSLQHLYETPLTDENGGIDSVMQAGYEIDKKVYSEITTMTVGTLKNHLLASDSHEIMKIGKGLTPVMVSALAKLMDIHELIFVSRKIVKTTRARTLIGLPGCLSFRLQPNHPNDSLDAISLMVYTDLSLGMGDCLIGVNPSEGSVENVSRILHHLDKLRQETGVPSQICVLGHVKTQLAALDQQAPVEILFQSFAGTERTLTEEFDVTVELMDQAYTTMAKRGPLAEVADQFMYFETGQGSEMSYRKHNGIDMTTCEALCYGLCRRYDPFMVNNATGFIGPETHSNDFELMAATLQDHFMGKLLGLPMGISPSYTLHSGSHPEGQQMAAQLATAAGANFFMDVYLGSDRMLAHFVNSGHDDQTMREIYDRRPAPEYLTWAVKKGIFELSSDGNVKRGLRWGDPRQFISSESEFLRLCDSLPLAPGFENAGPRPVNSVQRILRVNQAVGREAVHSELKISELEEFGFRVLSTNASNRIEHLKNPEVGSQLCFESRKKLSGENHDVQIVVTDGLSAEAVHHNIPNLLPIVQDGLKSRSYIMGQPILVPYGRVKLAEAIGDLLLPRLVILLIGERPGGDAFSSRSLSAYLAIRLSGTSAHDAAVRYSGNQRISYEYTVITNIYSGGIPAVEAGSVVAEKAMEILEYQAAGNRLETILNSL